MVVRSLGISEGDEVITTPFSFVASANCMLYENARPRFVDIEPDTMGLDPDAVESAIGPRTAGILPVHVFGRPCRIAELVGIAEKRGLRVIEDACEALGSKSSGRPMGSFGDASVFAFYPNKQITTGEGAVIITADSSAAQMMRAMRNQGRVPGDTWLQHTILGYNYRLDEMSAALGRVQMGRLDELLEKRALVASWYNQHLDQLSGVQTLKVLPHTTRMSWFVYVVRFDPIIDRDHVALELKARGVPARPYFLPIHLQPYMAERFGYREGDFPVTEDLGRRGLALPFSSVMTEGQVDLVCSVLAEVIELA
jgi:perosamine synthetase